MIPMETLKNTTTSTNVAIATDIVVCSFVPVAKKGFPLAAENALPFKIVIVRLFQLQISHFAIQIFSLTGIADDDDDEPQTINCYSLHTIGNLKRCRLQNNCSPHPTTNYICSLKTKKSNNLLNATLIVVGNY